MLPIRIEISESPDNRADGVASLEGETQ